MRITEVKEKSVRLEAAIKNSLVDFSSMTVSVVALCPTSSATASPLWASASTRSAATHSRGCCGALHPAAVGRRGCAHRSSRHGEFGPSLVRDVVMKNEKPGGHGERSTAVAAIELAAWDLAAKLEDVPLYRYLADRYLEGEPDTRVEVYAAGGYYQDGSGIDALQNEMRGYLDMGYTHIKMKIGGAPARRGHAAP